MEKWGDAQPLKHIKEFADILAYVPEIKIFFYYTHITQSVYTLILGGIPPKINEFLRLLQH